MILPADHRFSFSQLSLFHQCPLAFRLKYIDGVGDEGNGFSDFGLICHKLLEEWAKGELPEIALAEEYEARYDETVTHPFPPFPKGMGGKYYDAGLSYFENFDGFGEEYEVVAAEQRFTSDFNGHPVVGIVDLVLKDKKSGGLVVVDHKSKSAAQMQKDMPLYREQLYLYARFIKENYGVFPKKLGFNLFREGGQMVWEEFNHQAYQEMVDWVNATITVILGEKEWPSILSLLPTDKEKKKRTFFCRYICSSFDSCPEQEYVLYGGKESAEGRKT